MKEALQSSTGYNGLTGGFDLIHKANEYWTEVVKTTFPDVAEHDDKKALPSMIAFKAWQQLYADAFNARKLRVQDMQTLAHACIEQQKDCFEHHLSWCKCYLAVLQTLGRGLRNAHNPAEVLKECIDLSREYIQYSANLLKPQSEAVAESTESSATGVQRDINESDYSEARESSTGAVESGTKKAKSSKSRVS